MGENESSRQHHSCGFLATLKGSVRRLIVGLAAWMVVYVVIRLIVNARVRLLDGRVPDAFKMGSIIFVACSMATEYQSD